MTFRNYIKKIKSLFNCDARYELAKLSFEEQNQRIKDVYAENNELKENLKTEVKKRRELFKDDGIVNDHERTVEYKKQLIADGYISDLKETIVTEINRNNDLTEKNVRLAIKADESGKSYKAMYRKWRRAKSAIEHLKDVGTIIELSQKVNDLERELYEIQQPIKQENEDV